MVKEPTGRTCRLLASGSGHVAGAALSRLQAEIAQ
jgi:hypothetical protein